MSLIALGGLLAYFLQKGSPSTIGKLNLADAVAVTSLVINVSLFCITILALIVAIAAYRDAKQSGTEQLNALTASRQALEGVAATAKSEQELLSRVQGTLEAQLAVANEQNRRELERLGRRPKLEIVSVNNVPAEQIRKGPLRLEIAAASHLRLTFRNVGNMAVFRPAAVFVVQPATLSIQQPGAVIPQIEQNKLQISGPMIQDMQPYSDVRTDYDYPIALTIPSDVTRFVLTYVFFGATFRDGREVLTLSFQGHSDAKIMPLRLVPTAVRAREYGVPVLCAKNARRTPIVKPLKLVLDSRSL